MTTDTNTKAPDVVLGVTRRTTGTMTIRYVPAPPRPQETATNTVVLLNR